jgi:hypothetical protein
VGHGTPNVGSRGNACVTDRQIRCEPSTSANGSALCRRSDADNPPRVRHSFAGGDEIPASSYV